MKFVRAFLAAGILAASVFPVCFADESEDEGTGEMNYDSGTVVKADEDAKTITFKPNGSEEELVLKVNGETSMKCEWANLVPNADVEAEYEDGSDVAAYIYC